MKCIYRKVIRYEKKHYDTNKWYSTTRDEAYAVKAEFADCHGADCPMYKDGKCLKALRDLNDKAN
jgi:hypothetical protein